MEHKKFILIKDYRTKEGTISKGNEITLFREMVFLNGGLIMPSYQAEILSLISDENLRKEYLKEVKIVQNKI